MLSRRDSPGALLAFMPIGKIPMGGGPRQSLKKKIFFKLPDIQKILNITID